MAQGMQLSQGLALQQVLSPQMQQSLALLQAHVLELRNLVEQEMAQNPVLEEIPTEERPDAANAEGAGAGESEGPSLDPSEPPSDVLFDPATEKPEVGAVDDFQAKLEQLTQLDQEWRDHFTQTNVPLRQSDVDDEKRQFLFDSLTQPTSLRAELAEQLRFLAVSEELLPYAELIIGNLNEEGYLRTPLSTLAQTNEMPLEKLEEALRAVQSLDPAGIAARDLRECLLLQLERAGQQESLEYKVVRDHLDELGRRRYQDIGDALGVYPDEIQDAAENIGKLRPRPGMELSPSEPDYVMPEIEVTRNEGKFLVTLRDEPLPRLRISHTYKDLLTQANSDPEVREYLREKMRAGKFLIRCLDQREQTIKRIAEEVVRRQHEFFDRGRAHLKPMTMAQVAETVGVHETTVSRAVAGKYMNTPQGVLELRALFTSGVATSDGGAVASTGVKEFIAEMVKGEDPAHPLTDDQIEAKLKERGIKIARRTVAKYRNEMKILPVALRRNA
ncbi:MAG: RNA polymerase factor sigma-54 [Verrucomicrobiales bacterium]|nr:RNA polymerase factor sigma-54 [Verrucomicrobiales bacterium]